MSTRPQKQESAGASRLAHVLEVGTWRGGPQPKTFPPSREDLLESMRVKFGDPEEAERRRQVQLAKERAEKAEKAEKAKKAEKAEKAEKEANEAEEEEEGEERPQAAPDQR
mgnify:CR=1 FL=1